MKTDTKPPTTLLEAVIYFADPDVALQFVASLRWPGGATCPECQSENVAFLGTRRVWKCRECRRQFSAKVGTIFEDSPIPLSKWLPAMWLIANCKNGISSYEVARALKVTQKTAWFMMHRIRTAMATPAFGKMEGVVEADETFVGGRAINMHGSKIARLSKRRRGGYGKTAVMGLLKRKGADGRHSTVRAAVTKTVRKPNLQSNVRAHVAPGATVYTDALPSYRGLDETYAHEVVNHAETYVRGNVHTNGIENFWSLLKRSINGTYVSVDPFHLNRYVAEQVFRFNERATNDASRFMKAAIGIIGRRLDYATLTGAGIQAS
jgi:transposase-like protein